MCAFSCEVRAGAHRPSVRPKWSVTDVSPGASARLRFGSYVGAVEVVLAVAVPNANVILAPATLCHWILPW